MSEPPPWDRPGRPDRAGRSGRQRWSSCQGPRRRHCRRSCRTGGTGVDARPGPIATRRGSGSPLYPRSHRSHRGPLSPATRANAAALARTQWR